MWDFIFELPVDGMIQASISDYNTIVDSLLLMKYDYEKQLAFTIPTQFAYSFYNGSSITSYIEYQNIENKYNRDEVYPNHIDRSGSFIQDINNTYLSISYRSPEKWSLTFIYDSEVIRQDNELFSENSWPGIDLTMDIQDNHQLSIFYGSNRGGLRCANGVCAYQPAFQDGFKISLKSIF